MKIYPLVFREEDRDKFNEIARGQKVIETRAATAKYTPIKVGDSLKFVCGEDVITKRVAKVDHYKNLDEMFFELPLIKILPSAKDYGEAKKIFYSFPGYKEKITSNGILAFTLAS